MRGLRLGLGLGAGRGTPPPFSISFTGLSTDSLGTYGQIGSHAAISYTITPDLGTETVKWSNSSNPADAATFGTGASPTAFSSVDGFSVYLHVTDDPGDGAVTRTFSFSARYAPGSFAALTNQAFADDSGNQTYVFDAATGANLTWTYALTSPPPGVTIVSATRTITHDTNALALQTGTVITVTATDQYGRAATGSPRTYTLDIAEAPVLSAFGSGSIDDLELDPPAIFIEHNIGGTLTGDFHSSATPPAKEAGDIGFFTTSLSGDAVTDISTALNTFLDLHPGETGYLHFRLTNGTDSNVITTQEITTPASGEDADAAAYLDAVEVADGEALEAGVRAAVNAFVVELKAESLWTAIGSSCILAGARTLDGALVPLKGTAPTNNNFVSGDYNRETGLVGNGTTKYLNANRLASADGQDDHHIAAFVTTSGTGAIMGHRNGGAGDTLLNADIAANWPFRSRILDFVVGAQGTRSLVGATGLIGLSRAISTEVITRTADANEAVASVSTTPGAHGHAVFARLESGGQSQYSTARISFYSLGSSIDLAKLETAVDTLNAALASAIV